MVAEVSHMMKYVNTEAACAVANQIRCPRFADTSMTDFDFEKLVVAVDIWNWRRMQKQVYIYMYMFGFLDSVCGCFSAVHKLLSRLLFVDAVQQQQQ